MYEAAQGENRLTIFDRLASLKYKCGNRHCGADTGESGRDKKRLQDTFKID